MKLESKSISVIHAPNESEMYAVYYHELELLKTGGESMSRDIMLNSFFMGIPFAANYLLSGGWWVALSAASVLNLSLSMACFAVAGAMFAIYRQERKASADVMRSIQARKN